MSERTPVEQARRHVLAASVEMWIWLVVAVPLTVAIIFLPDRVGVAIVTVLSIYALVLTAKGNKRASEAEVAGYVNPAPDEGSVEADE